MEFVAMAVLIATVKNLIDLARRATGGDGRGALTQVLSYLVGFGVAALFSTTAYAAELDFGGITLADANVGTLAVIGLALGSSAGVVKDVFKAVDNTQSESTPPLGGGR
jgi:NADH:ubiquinone oxidoreductase subunit F (NADH-binding)